MTTSEFLAELVRINLIAAAAIVLVALIRKPVRRWCGARIAYALWLIVPAAALLGLLPARTVTVVMDRTPPPPIDPVPALVPLELPAPVIETATQAPFDWTAVLMAVWIAGAAVAVTLLLFRQRRALKALTDGDIGPAVVGVFQPRIITPPDFKTRFSRDERAMVLAHEHTHIRRQDARINALTALIQCVFWFNPLIHVAAHLMRIDQEMACDAQTLAHRPKLRRVYAEALLKAQLAANPLPLGCYWPAGTQHPLTERIAMLNQARIPVLRRIAGGALTVALAAGAGLTAWAAKPAEVEVTFAAVSPGGAGTEFPGVQTTATGELRFPVTFMLPLTTSYNRMRITAELVIDRDAAATIANYEPQLQAAYKAALQPARSDDFIGAEGAQAVRARLLEAANRVLPYPAQGVFLREVMEIQATNSPRTVFGVLDGIELGLPDVVYRFTDPVANQKWIATGDLDHLGLLPKAVLDELVGAEIAVVSEEDLPESCAVACAIEGGIIAFSRPPIFPWVSDETAMGPETTITGELLDARPHPLGGYYLLRNEADGRLVYFIGPSIRESRMDLNVGKRARATGRPTTQLACTEACFMYMSRFDADIDREQPSASDAPASRAAQRRPRNGPDDPNRVALDAQSQLLLHGVLTGWSLDETNGQLFVSETGAGRSWSVLIGDPAEMDQDIRRNMRRYRGAEVQISGIGLIDKRCNPQCPVYATEVGVADSESSDNFIGLGIRGRSTGARPRMGNPMQIPANVRLDGDDPIDTSLPTDFRAVDVEGQMTWSNGPSAPIRLVSNQLGGRLWQTTTSGETIKFEARLIDPNSDEIMTTVTVTSDGESRQVATARTNAEGRFDLPFEVDGNAYRISGRTNVRSLSLDQVALQVALIRQTARDRAEYEACGRNCNVPSNPNDGFIMNAYRAARQELEPLFP